MDFDPVIEDCLTRLEEYSGIKALWKKGRRRGFYDGALEIVLEGRRLTLNVQVKEQLRMVDLGILQRQAPLDLGEIIVLAATSSPKDRLAFQKNGINYLDASGNVCLRLPGLILLQEGMKAPESARVRKGALSKAGLQLVFLLLSMPSAIEKPYRDLAEMAGVSLGSIQIAFAWLKRRGFLTDLGGGRRALRQKKKLFNHWLLGYEDRLRPALLRGNFRFGKGGGMGNTRLLRQSAWAGEAGASLVGAPIVPSEFHLFTSESPSDLIRNYHLLPDVQGKVHVLGRFWNFESDGNAEVAPPLLLYAELMLTGDPRCIASADWIYSQMLKASIE